MSKKPKKKDYPVNGMQFKRYGIRYGRWGAYFHDSETDMPVDLEAVLSKLNLYELRKRQLRWYVETYGEVRP